MKLYILSAIFVCNFLASASVQAQPAVLEARPLLAAPESTEAALPDLSPTILTPEDPTRQPATILPNEGESVISPSLEPWQKSRIRRFKGKTADEIFVTLPYEVQNLILNETYKVNADCNHYDIYSQFHDCECLGARYFEERVFTPESNKDTIVGHISGECTSVPGVAGYGYDQCISAMRYMLVPARIDDYCTCFANKFAENYQLNPYPDFGHLRALNSMTNTYCLRTVRSVVKNLP